MVTVRHKIQNLAFQTKHIYTKTKTPIMENKKWAAANN